MAFIIAEEKALYEKVSDIKVFDPRHPAGQVVKAWFRFPEGERINEYPYITVNGPITMTEARASGSTRSPTPRPRCGRRRRPMCSAPSRW